MATIEAQGELWSANDGIYNMLWGFGQREGAFLCECDLFCTEEVSMTASEYARVRDRGGLVYAPGHRNLKPSSVGR